ncbi:MAG: hypothetical protein LBU98_04735, partial [Alistipes sp.]|nr:hypothetical protein [Alistipes sp.]MDR2883064.1 hypothetical protein [Alistipes sp.]
ALVERVEALQVVEGDGAGAPWAAFIASLDTLVERYAETLAVRRGRAAAERAREEQQAAAEEL